VAQHSPLAGIDDGDRVDARLGRQQTSGLLVVGEADRLHATERFQAGNADRNLAFRSVGLRVDHGDAVAIRIRDKDAI